MRRTLAVLTLLVGLFALTACGSDDDTADGAGSSEPVTIQVEFSGDTVTPNGERVEVPLGQDVEFEVKADAPGELHIHADPEKTLEYDAGTTVVQAGSFDRAGIYEVESHALDKTIVQLEVS
ncbi:hypothetical protein [Nocardioides insulae]|uniref:hypothetical protein n=1 Tax=Nocardioides insulae TaxID=394734 RepID=UPI0003F6E959|nr:hypothetical protein [Nocardioides insulae]